MWDTHGTEDFCLFVYWGGEEGGGLVMVLKLPGRKNVEFVGIGSVLVKSGYWDFRIWN